MQHHGGELKTAMANLALERTAGMRRFIQHEAARFPRGRSAPSR